MPGDRLAPSLWHLVLYHSKKDPITSCLVSKNASSDVISADHIEYGQVRASCLAASPISARRLGLVIESEFWRNLFIQTRARGVERAVVYDQPSASSYASWRRVRPLIAHLLGLFSLTLAPSRADQIRLPERGVADSKRLVNSGSPRYGLPSIGRRHRARIAFRKACVIRTWI
ncbi:MAG: hypothetical protein IIA34_11150 [Proteobacteria bacterium]|nr:hypothetical protein [Pseudomonadota bacterium]